MGKKRIYKVPFKRKREGKTNYYKRLTLLKSKKLLVVLRGSLKHFRVQFVEPKIEGDKTIVSAWSQQLIKKYGWKAPTGNVPAAYLTGYLCGKKATKLGINFAVPYFGLHRSTKGNRLFSAIKGLIDAGVTVPCEEKMLPEEERVKGEHVASYAQEILEENEALYYKRFSGYLSKGLKPEDLPNHFEVVKKRIESDFS